MPVSVSRLTHAYVEKFGLKLNKFIQHDNNTWYLFKGQRYRAWEVDANPEILGYPTNPTEKNKTAQNLFDQAVIKVPAAFPSWDQEGKGRCLRSHSKLVPGCRSLDPTQHSYDWSSCLIASVNDATTLNPSLLSLSNLGNKTGSAAV